MDEENSADGRLLIWQCGINMVKDAPWIGHGLGSFEAHYMDYQANFFKQCGQSRFSMLADNVKQPFNEYLGLLFKFWDYWFISIVVIDGNNYILL